MDAKSPDTQKHTPGPWTLSRNLGIASANGREILFPGHVSRGVDHPEREANARLIASAPALLEACQKALADLQDVHELADLPEQLRLNVVGSIGRLIGVIAAADGRHV